MSLRADYDIWHDKYHQLDPSYDDTSTPWYQWVSDTIGSVQGLKTLEVACGRGGFVRKLARSSALSCGVDFSFAAISIGEQRLAGHDSLTTRACYAQGDAHSLPFPDNAFDVLVSCETIEHLPSPLQGLREFYRVTRPGGTLFLTTPNYFNFMGLYELYAKLRHPKRPPDQPFDRLQIFVQTRGLLSKAGWKILASNGTVHQFPIWPGRNPVRWRALESSATLKRLLSVFALHYCIVGRKSKSAV